MGRGIHPSPVELEKLGKIAPGKHCLDSALQAKTSLGECNYRDAMLPAHSSPDSSLSKFVVGLIYRISPIIGRTGL